MPDTPAEPLPMPLAELPLAAIFDCDGTLADTMPAHFAAWRTTLDGLGYPDLFPEPQFYASAGTSAQEIIARLNHDHGTSMDEAQVAQEKEEAFALLIPGVLPIARVVAEARRLFAAGVPLAVASGGRRDVVEASLQTVGVRDLFAVVVGAEDVTHSKPAPDVFLRAAELLGVDPAGCVVFEDAPGGLLAAHRAGMRAVDITRFL